MPDDFVDRVRMHELAHREDGGVPRRLLASWQRSEEYGVPLEEVEPVFTGTDDLGSLFFQCGNEVLADLHSTLAGEPVSLMLTDAEGVVLSRLSGDRSLLQALDDVHLAPGFGYAERDVGTNGLGLALADRVPTLVRADQHYALSLCTFTCAAVPVFDPASGRLEGSVNLTTWSRSSSDLLLALARSAASNTTALMVARSSGRHPAPGAAGSGFPRRGAAAGTGFGHPARPLGSVERRGGSRRTRDGSRRPSSPPSARPARAGPHCSHRPRATLIRGIASCRRVHPRRPTCRRGWDCGRPNSARIHTAVIVRDVDMLPGWVAERLRDLIRRSTDSGSVPFAVTAERFEDIPAALAGLVDAVVPVPSLRDRPDDVLPLANHIATRTRGREIGFSTTAARALRGYDWPGNVDELSRVVAAAAGRADVVDIGLLPPEVLAGNTRHLSRIEAFERGEIVRVLNADGLTMAEVARELGMSRATLYRKIAQYNVQVPRERR